MNPKTFTALFNRFDKEDPVELLSGYSGLYKLGYERTKLLVNHPLLINQRSFLESLNIVQYDSFEDLLDRRQVYEDFYERNIVFDMLLEYRSHEFIIMYLSLKERRRIDVARAAQMILNGELVTNNDIMAVFIISNISTFDSQMDFDLFIKMDQQFDIFSGFIEDNRLSNSQDYICNIVLDRIFSSNNSNKKSINLLEYILMNYNSYLNRDQVVCQTIRTNNLEFLQLVTVLLEFKLDEYTDISKINNLPNMKIVDFLFDKYGGVDLCNFFLNILKKQNLHSAINILDIAIHCRNYMSPREMYEYIK